MSRLILAAVVCCALAGGGAAEPTQVTVRAQAKDAKFIGESMGGVAITLTDAATGKVLASGLTAGGTGDTAKLVTSPRVRGQAVSGSADAKFAATLDITQPTLVTATAKGPIGKSDAVITATSQMWLLPEAVGGDGWVIELPGLVVEPSLSTSGGLTVTAKVTLMCGCAISPGTTWDADHYEVIATVMQGTRVVKAVPLPYAGTTSTFAAPAPGLAPGVYRVVITAYNSRTGNTGVAAREVRVGG
jgi:hypothetical protein